MHEASSFCFVKRIKGIGGVGVWVLGVRLRMRGVCTTQRQTAAGRNSQKNTEKLGAIPNQRIKKREMHLSSKQTPFILSLTPKTHPPLPPYPSNF